MSEPQIAPQAQQSGAWLALPAALLVLASLFVISRGTKRYTKESTHLSAFGTVRVLLGGSIFKTFARLRNKYGNLIDMGAFGRHTITLNSFESAKALMDKRGAIYSDRPRMVFFRELLGSKAITFLPYGEGWRAQRRVIHQYFNAQAVKSFSPIQVEQTKALASQLLDTPQNFYKHATSFAATTIMRAVYGYRIKGPGDPFLVQMRGLAVVANQAGTPGATLLDLFPFIKYIPSWFPGGFYARLAVAGKPLVRETNEMPFSYAREGMVNGNAEPSMVSRALKILKGDDVTVVQDAAAGLFRAATITTAGTIMNFLAAILRHPDFARRAQAELDAVVGRDRLPAPSDFAELPFVHAIFKEVLRWNPPAPLGIPHRVMVKDEYNGSKIPAGSTIVANIWQIMHDPAIYDSPEEFLPSRFIEKPDLLDPREAVFGFGRRICPGRYFAENNIMLAISTILSLFDILPPLDAEGREYMPEIKFQDGFANHAEEFPCRIVPRDRVAIRELLESN